MPKRLSNMSLNTEEVSTMTTRSKISSFTYGEATTLSGQVISFECESGDERRAEIRKFIEENVFIVRSPVIKKTQVSHGGYVGYSRYKIKQLKYAGGGMSFIEAIEVKNAPDGKACFILHEYLGKYTRFSEWNSRKELTDAFERYWSGTDDNGAVLKKLPGFKRLVFCGSMTPWFYAIGHEVLRGDYAVSSGLEDDPCFRLGQRIAVEELNGKVNIKTCMGCRFIERKQDFHPYGTEIMRLIYLDDGEVLCVYLSASFENGWCNAGGKRIRLMQEGEIWILDAMNKFLKLLQGFSQGFQLKFADGRTFSGKVSSKGKQIPSVEGKYNLKVTMEDGEVRKGWVQFTPTLECPDIIQSIRKRLTSGSMRKLEVLDIEPVHDGKKWSGVFYTVPSEPGS